MHKLFKKHYEVFFQRAFRMKDTTDKIHSEINKFKRNNDFKDGEILHRFSKKELRYFVRSECPTERLPGKKEIKSYEVIKAAKRLRNFMNIPEHFVCSRCTKRDTCKFKDIIPPSKNTSVSDLLVMMNGLHNYESVVYQEKDAKKAEAAGAEEDELFEGDDQDVGAAAREELLAELEENEEEDLEEDEKDIEESEGEEEDEAEPAVELQDRYSHKTWDSALKLVDTLYPVVEDIRYRKGSGCKQYISTYISENKKLVGAKNQALEESGDEDEEIVQAPRKQQGRYQKNENVANRKREKREFQKESGDVAWGTKPERISAPASQGKTSRPPRRVIEEEEDVDDEFDGQQEEEFDEKEEFEAPRKEYQKKFDNRGNKGFNQQNKGSYQNKPRRQYDSERAEEVRGRPDFRNKQGYNNKGYKGGRNENSFDRNRGKSQEGRGRYNEDRGNRKSFKERENYQSDVRDRAAGSKNFKATERVTPNKGNTNRPKKGRTEGKMDLSRFMNDIKS